MKVGDKIVLLDSWYGYPKGTIITLLAHHKSGMPYLPYPQLNSKEGTYITSISNSIFKLIKKEISNDIQWLDAIQQNFKEGI